MKNQTTSALFETQSREFGLKLTLKGETHKLTLAKHATPLAGPAARPNNRTVRAGSWTNLASFGSSRHDQGGIVCQSRREAITNHNFKLTPPPPPG